ncbi:hypothetical protein PUR34_19505 [Streptomyces sp. JV185]|nr:hypothetical protein [Streptomyces sp. JV185]MEE1770261.1 hypothetical protein [Streptomyces sp. JV185]
MTDRPLVLVTGATPADVSHARTLHPGMRTYGDGAESARDQFARLL